MLLCVARGAVVSPLWSSPSRSEVRCGRESTGWSRIAALLARGLVTRETALDMRLTEKVIRNRLSDIYRKRQVRDFGKMR